MSKTWQSKCVGRLRAMNSGAENAWDEADTPEIYLIIMNQIGEEFSCKAVTHAIMHNRWRPSPAELRDIALDLASILPTDGSMRTEIFHKACTQGYEDPKFTHPICDLVTHHMGGWPAVRAVNWHLDFNGRQDFDNKFDRALNNAVPEWRELVAEQVALPEALRNPTLRIGKPKTAVYIQPKLEGEAKQAPLPSISELLAMMPEDIRQETAANIKRIGTMQSISAIGSKRVDSGLTRAVEGE